MPQDQEKTSSAKTIDVYLSLFVFGFLYQLVLAWDAVRLKNTIQVVGLCLYNMGLLIYAGVQTDQIHDVVTGDYSSGAINDPADQRLDVPIQLWWKIRPSLVAIPVIISFFTIVLCGIAWKLYQEFAWTIYKNISADVRMKRRYLIFQVGQICDCQRFRVSY